MINIYNEITKQKEKFTPSGNYITMYVCGPTVYDYFHAGNARCFVIFDFIRRVFEYAGYKVKYVQNFTDIEDKMIARAIRENISLTELADRFIEEYKKDAEGLGITPADIYPRATEHIKEMIEMIAALIEKGHAYKSETSADVYFSAKSFERYGCLSGKNLEDLQQGERVNEELQEEKREPFDFVLWKSKKEGEPSWDSPWGEGRPGWHIECSAMARKYLGDTIDIHCGGKDLEFPHHENELAQSECATGKTFARYWLRNGFLNIDNEKMSKSEGNFFTVREIAEKYGYMPLRFFILSSNYRMPLNFSEEVIKAAQNSLERIFLFGENLDFAIKNAEITNISDHLDELSQYRDKFKETLFDDFNSAAAVSILFELIRDVNIKIGSGEANREYLELARELYDEFCGLFGFVPEKKESAADELSEEYILAQIEARTAAKANRDFKTADEIRDTLKSQGVILEDTPSGVKWRRE